MTRQLALGSETLLAVAGVDEAGRGPLAGPVVAAAVILDDDRPIPELADSKRLTPTQRTRVARAVRTEARAFAVGLAEPAEIDSINILEASLLAMTRAIAKLSIAPALVRVDGIHTPRFPGDDPSFSIEAVIRGDESVPAISAASILAKVCRDRLMCRWHRRFPVYGFDRHKGYPTRAHVAALAAHGPCPIHRRTFGPVRDCLEAAS